MIRVAAAQTAPVFLDRAATTARVIEWLEKAASQDVHLLAFGETFLPGYPVWIDPTGGARFGDPGQKEAYRAYLDGAVRLDGPELAEIAAVSKATGVFAIVGAVERVGDSVYCSAIPVDPEQGVLAPHRKLKPTYEERLVWADGDGHGLRHHVVRGVRVTMLNCWENWMPQARHAVYAAGTDLHVAVWPGGPHNTKDITRFIALEGRAYVLSASALLRSSDIPDAFPLKSAMPADETFMRGGSAIAAPDGQWLVEPVVDEEQLVIATVDPAVVARERHNFDPVGHYSRPDVFDVRVDRTRRRAAVFSDGD